MEVQNKTQEMTFYYVKDNAYHNLPTEKLKFEFIKAHPYSSTIWKTLLQTNNEQPKNKKNHCFGDCF